MDRGCNGEAGCESDCEEQIEILLGPLLLGEGMVVGPEYGGIWLQFRGAEQLSRHLRQGSDGHYGWHWHLFHALLRGVDIESFTGRKGPAQWASDA